MKLLFDRNREEVEDLVGNTKLEEDKNREIVTDINKPINMLIEGDNLLSLNHLLETHTNLVNLIYIDPPYRTQNKNFRYNDYFKTHDKWLSFMEKRLILAKELLTNDGIVFISIDDNEFAQLKLLCDDVFGEINTDILVWQKTDSRVDKNTNSKQIRRFKNIHEYILVCYKNKSITFLNKMLRLPDWKNNYTNPDKDSRGAYKQGIISFKEGHAKENKESEYYYSVTTPSGRVITRHWFITKNEFLTKLSDNRIYFPCNGDGIPAEKIFVNEEKEYYMETILRGVGTSSSSKDELLDIFKDRSIFDTPKPTKLLKELIRVGTNKNMVILDFFAGSGTTGHAVLELNKEDGGNRQFILCTNNENNICEEVTYQRLNKVINGYTTPKGKEVEGLGGNLKYYKVVKK